MYVTSYEAHQKKKNLMNCNGVDRSQLCIRRNFLLSPYRFIIKSHVHCTDSLGRETVSKSTTAILLWGQHCRSRLRLQRKDWDNPRIKELFEDLSY